MDGNHWVADKKHKGKDIVIDPEIIKLIETWGVNYGIGIQCLCVIFTLSMAVIFQCNVIFNKKQYIEIFKFIQNDYKRLMNLPEYETLYTIAMQGRHHAVIYIYYVCISSIIYFILPITVTIREELQKNLTKEREFLYPLNYHVDQEKYFYQITFVSYISTAVILTLFIAHDSMYIVLVQHSCALFAVTGFRLRTAHILNMDNQLDYKDLGHYEEKLFTFAEQQKVYKKLIIGIKEHKRALQYTKLLHTVTSGSLFFMLLLNIIAISINGVQSMLNLGNIYVVCRMVTWEMGAFTHLFWICLPGQRLVNFSEQVYYDALDCVWNVLFLKSRILYQFLLMNTIRPSELVAMKMTSLNMETFLSVTQAALSYFTVLSSTF